MAAAAVRAELTVMNIVGAMAVATGVAEALH